MKHSKLINNINERVVDDIKGRLSKGTFSEGITDKVVTAMADKSPLRVLFRDACFKEDAQKINIYEQFKQFLDWSDNDAFNNIRVI